MDVVMGRMTQPVGPWPQVGNLSFCVLLPSQMILLTFHLHARSGLAWVEHYWLIEVWVFKLFHKNSERNFPGYTWNVGHQIMTVVIG